MFTHNCIDPQPQTSLLLSGRMKHRQYEFRKSDQIRKEKTVTGERPVTDLQINKTEVKDHLRTPSQPFKPNKEGTLQHLSAHLAEN